MANDSSITLPQSAYSIQEAAALIEKSDQTVRKYIKDGRFPNVSMVPGDKGDEYSIPASDLGAYIAEKGLVINLHQSHDQSETAPSELISGLVDAREKIGHLTGQVENLTSDRERITRERDQARSDLEHERTGHEQTAAQLTESDKAKAVAEARVEELRTQLKKAEIQNDAMAQERDSLDLQHRELQKSSAESLSALSADLDGVRNDLENANEQTQVTAGERNELAAKLAEAEASMGWWTRRKYQR